MVEVFKTNVKGPGQAKMLVRKIQDMFVDYIVNFDLKDCDNILRVECVTGGICSSVVIGLVKNYGYHAEILPDDCFIRPESVLL